MGIFNIFRTIFNIFGKFFGLTLWFFYNLFNNYGLAIVCFTLLIFIIMFPLEIKRVQTMSKTMRMSKKTKEIREKYAKNKEKLNEELAKFYQEEGTPMQGSLVQFLSSFVFLGVFAAIRRPLELMFNISKEKISAAQHILVSFSKVSCDIQNIQLEIIKRFPEFSGKLTIFDDKDIKNIVDFREGVNFLGLDLLSKPVGSSFASMLWILPVICAITALIPLLFKKLNSAMPIDQSGPGQGCAKIIPVILVGVFVYIVWVNPAALGVYYIVSNLFRLLQSYIVNKFYNVHIYTAKTEAARIALLETEEILISKTITIG